MYGFGDYVIAFFSKGYTEIVHKCYVGGSYIDLVHERAEKMFYTIPDAHYYECLFVKYDFNTYEDALLAGIIKTIKMLEVWL